MCTIEACSTVVDTKRLSVGIATNDTMCPTICECCINITLKCSGYCVGSKLLMNMRYVMLHLWYCLLGGWWCYGWRFWCWWGWRIKSVLLRPDPTLWLAFDRKPYWSCHTLYINFVTPPIVLFLFPYDNINYF